MIKIWFFWKIVKIVLGQACFHLYLYRLDRAGLGPCLEVPARADLYIMQHFYITYLFHFYNCAKYLHCFLLLVFGLPIIISTCINFKLSYLSIVSVDIIAGFNSDYFILYIIKVVSCVSLEDIVYCVNLNLPFFQTEKKLYLSLPLS